MAGFFMNMLGICPLFYWIFFAFGFGEKCVWQDLHCMFSSFYQKKVQDRVGYVSRYGEKKNSENGACCHFPFWRIIFFVRNFGLKNIEAEKNTRRKIHLTILCGPFLSLSKNRGTNKIF